MSICEARRSSSRKFIEENLPNVGSKAEIPDTFEAFWEKECVHAFDKLVAEENLDAGKLKKVIDRHVYTGQPLLLDTDIANIILKLMQLMERGPPKKRVFERVVDYVATFIKGIAAEFAKYLLGGAPSLALTHDV